jgi:catechol 2,3-dioxygenase-like lactoylglutathione lyase family enzyme
MNLVLALLLAVTLSTPAPTGSPTPPKARTTGAFFALSVANVETVSQWYRDFLKLKVAKSGEAPNGIAKFALLEGEGVLVELIQHREAKDRSAVAPSATEAYQIHGIFKVGMIVEGLEGIYSRAKEQHIPIAYDMMPAKDIPLRSFSVRDPEGNLVQLFGR